MTSASAAVDEAAFALLENGVTLAPVFQDVPEDTMPPVVILGDLRAEPFTDDPGDPDRRVTLTITTVTAGEERRPCTAIQDEIEAVLGNAREQRDSWDLAFRSLGSDATLTPDAGGYVGTTTIEVIAFSQG